MALVDVMLSFVVPGVWRDSAVICGCRGLVVADSREDREVSMEEEAVGIGVVCIVLVDNWE